MIRSIIAISIRQKAVIGLLVLALIGGGLYSAGRIPINAMPDITNNQVQVITTAPKLATEDVEQFITYPVELAMANLTGVREIRSVSRFGLSVVTIVFDDDMGTYLPRQLVGEKLAQVRAEIPTDYGVPAMGPITTGLGEVYQYTLEPQPGYEDRYSVMELRSMQDWIVKRQFAMVEGVIEINSFGGKVKQYEVAVDPDRLKAYDLDVGTVLQALRDNHGNTGGAYIERDHRAQFIRGEGLIRNLDALRAVTITHQNGQPVQIEDVATVGYGHANRYGGFTRDGQGEAVGGMILMLKGENSYKVVQNVKERVAQIQRSLPEGVRLSPFLDRSELIGRTTNTVAENLALGGLIVVFVLVLLLGNVRGGLIVASTIPLSLLFAFIMMNAFGVSANLMSLGAIDFGIIVDGSVIIVESAVFFISRRLDQQPGKAIDREEGNQLVEGASVNMMRSAIFGQLIILIVFVPILTLTGVEGKMFIPMALTFGFAILGAMLLCLTYVPMMSALVLSRRPAPSDKPRLDQRIIGGLQRAYRPVIDRALDHPYNVLALAVVLLGLALWTFTRMGSEFIPQLDEGDLAIQAQVRPGSSLAETMKRTTQIENLLLSEFPDAIETVVSRIGAAEIPTDPMPMDIADMAIILRPEDEWTSAESKDELIYQMDTTLKRLPGINFTFTQPVELRFNELLSGVREDIAIKLFGEDLEVMARKGEEIGALIADIPGVEDLRVEATTGLPQISIDIQREALARYGLSVAEVNLLVQRAFAGGKAGVIYEGARRYDLVVRLAEDQRRSIEDVRELYVTLHDGSQIPLKEVADIRYAPGPMQISREGTQRRISVGVNNRGRDVASVVADIRRRLEAELDLPPGYYLQYGGSFENLQQARKRLQIVVPVAMGLILVLLVFALGVVSQALMIYAAIPMAAIGGVAALALRGMPFSISAGIGFIVLFGVAVLNGLVLISALNELRAEGVEDLRERIRQGAQRRLRPILLTAATDVLGFLPMAVSTSAGAEVQRPLATVVIGGLLTATLLTLVVLPVLYLLLERRRESPSNSTSGARPSPSLGLLGVFFFFFGGWMRADAQEAEAPLPPLSREAAIEAALERHPRMRAAAAGLRQAEALKATALDLPPTLFYSGVEETPGAPDRGVFTLVAFQQNLQWPGVYTARRKVLEAQRARAEAGQALDAARLRLETTLAWEEAAYQRERLRLERRLDSLHQRLLEAARLQRQTGAIDAMDFLSMRSRQAQVALQRQQAAEDFRTARQTLGTWTNSRDTPRLAFDSLRARSMPLLDTARLFRENPALQAQQREVQTAEAQSQVARRDRLPGFYTQGGPQQIRGESGFYTLQVGLRLPLDVWSGRGKTEAAEARWQIARAELEHRRLALRRQAGQLAGRLCRRQQALRHYREHLLPLSREQLRTGLQRYAQGAADLDRFLQYYREALDIQRRYLMLVRDFNRDVAGLEFLYGR